MAAPERRLRALPIAGYINLLRAIPASPAAAPDRPAAPAQSINPQSVNRAIKRIIADYNATEEVAAKKQHREAVLLPDFSAHHLRHTFCTRLCENETNLKVIQSVMGHKDIQTTMDVYAEATEQKKQESFERLAAKLDIF